MEIQSEKAKPFIKWAGGKQSLLRSFVDYFPKDFERYFEPFLGGGSVFFDLNPNAATLNDANEWLIDTYTAIRDDYVKVAKKLSTMKNTKENFLKVRKVNLASLSLIDKAAHFIYLNKTCFRGLFRVNRKGFFNVPYGEYDRRYYDLENLLAVSLRLRSVKFSKGDFENGLMDIGPDDFIYFDPPYYKIGGYSDFNRYTPGQFRESDHIRLAARCNELDAMGVRWAVSNSDTPLVKKLFAGFNQNKISARREINLNSKKRNTTELLITNY